MGNKYVGGINLLPCTNQVNNADLHTATNIVTDGIPPGYVLEPTVTEGRNRHRWIDTFSRNDNNYDLGLPTLAFNEKRL